MAYDSWIKLIGKLTGRCSESRKVGNNTYLKRRRVSDGGEGIAYAVAVRLHDTDVLTFYPDGRIELNNGGFPTRTTHDRMDSYLPPGYRVSGEPLQTRRSDGGMTVLRHATHVGEKYTVHGEVTVDNSATINADGSLDGGDVAKYRAQRREERLAAQRPRNRARYWANKARSGGKFTGTVADIMAEENASVRVSKMTCYGMERFFLDANPTVLDENSGYQLLSIPMDGPWNSRIHSMRALKMACSTTGAVYINAVPPDVRTVAEGLDFMFNVKDYLGTIGQQS